MKAILTYHSIDTSGSVISISPALFEQQVRWLASSRVAVVGMSALRQVPDGQDAVAITFDDAYTNFQTHAWPVLQQHGMPVTLFVPTGFVGRANSWSAIPGGGMPSLPILDWSAIGRLQEQGVTLGAHSRTHPDLRTLTAQAVEDEVLGSIEDIERETGRRPATFCYPYGYWSAPSASTVARVCSHACTTVLSPLRDSDAAHLLPRLDMFYLHGPGRLELFGTPAFAAYIRARAIVRVAGQWARAKLHA